MLFSTVFTSTLLLAGTALAEGIHVRQDLSAMTYRPTDKPSSTKTAQTPQGSDQIMMTVVKVGSPEGNTVFEPDNLQVPAGSLVQFQFWPKNHSVVRSSFDQPCVPIEQSTPGSHGFFSGFMPIQQSLGIFTIMVNDTKPIWFYCSQAKHCQNGMVGVINAPASNSSRTIDTFKALAKNAPNNITPGSSAGGGSPSNSTTPQGGSPSATPASTSQAPAVATGKSGAENLRVGGAIAIVAFGMALLA
ncbi:hypothetical protein FGG08_004986 [Glutinoglossum americanum]|uniref:Extracellular serine-rich protein n=1 Tax=Glutinoglossum americanum TaxID=1670608 RepID=A0A9P8KYZ8_9PEZI|nr:hypothetical protein FGG08_004986 [Glutinoglossum americanum]